MTTADSPNAAPTSEGAVTPARRGFGVDVGGSGIKGGIVDLDTGELVGDRYKLLTPQPATPDAVAKTIAAVVNEFGWTGPLGVTYPGVVTNGIVRTAANVDKKWIGTNARDIISAGLNGQEVAVLNDADAAGWPRNVRRGQGQHRRHRAADIRHRYRVGGHPQRDFAAQHRVRPPRGGRQGSRTPRRVLGPRQAGWSYEKWTKQVTKVLIAIENAMCPDLFIAGGGISRKADKWIPLLKNRTPVVAAALQNTAGIVGAAMAATRDVTH